MQFGQDTDGPRSARSRILLLGAVSRQPYSEQHSLHCNGKVWKNTKSSGTANSRWLIQGKSWESGKETVRLAVDTPQQGRRHSSDGVVTWSRAGKLANRG